MERMWVGVMWNCVYGNEEENGVIENVEGVKVLYYPIYVSLVIKKLIEVYI